MRRLLLLAALSASAGCGLALDFDDLSDLPCPCDNDHVCLNGSDRCVPRASVELFKSCSQDTDGMGDELCPQNAICQAVNGLGPRCLPKCEPTTYATPEAGQMVLAQCPFTGTTCWPTDRGGVCSEGECRTTPNNCPPGQECVNFNGAGVCFTQCDIYQTNPFPCANNEACHPIGSSKVTACVPTGERRLGEPCTADDLCTKVDGNNRPLVCDRPQASTEGLRRCLAICTNDGDCIPPNESCTLARPDIDPTLGTDLLICQGASG